MSEDKIVTRAYNEIKIDNLKGTFSKFSKTDRLMNEINYYAEISNDPSGIEYLFPRMVDVRHVYDDSTSYNSVGEVMVLELLGMNNLGNAMINNRNRYKSKWPDILSLLEQILRETLHSKKLNTEQHEREDNARKMYIEKTEREYFNLVRDLSGHRSTFNSPELKINGTSYLNFTKIWPEVSTYISDNMLEYEATVIHGDCCFSNILYSDVPCPTMKFVDPRGSFGSWTVYGDKRYDIAKLYHSVDGKYELIINDKFDLVFGGEVAIDEFNVSFDEVGRIRSIFEEVFFEGTSEYSGKEILILQGLIFVGMCARHYDNEMRQMVMYTTGIRLLNEAMEI